MVNISGPPHCESPVVIFGGDGEVYDDIRTVEVGECLLWFILFVKIYMNSDIKIQNHISDYVEIKEAI